MKKAPELTDVQIGFVKFFDGDVESTAHKCGISSKEANSFLRNVAVRDAIRDRELVENPARQRLGVANRLERQQLLTEFMKGLVSAPNGTETVLDPSTRLRALELLGKMEGDYVERREHSGPNGGPVISATVHVDAKDLKERIQTLIANRVEDDCLKFLNE